MEHLVDFTAVVLSGFTDTIGKYRCLKFITETKL